MLLAAVLDEMVRRRSPVHSPQISDRPDFPFRDESHRCLPLCRTKASKNQVSCAKSQRPRSWCAVPSERASVLRQITHFLKPIPEFKQRFQVRVTTLNESRHATILPNNRASPATEATLPARRTTRISNDRALLARRLAIQLEESMCIQRSGQLGEGERVPDFLGRVVENGSKHGATGRSTLIENVGPLGR